jgi:hypothetical protein
MRRFRREPLALLAASVVVAAAAAVSSPRTVHACSAGGDFEPVKASDVIVAGQIVGYEPLSAPLETNPMVPIRLRMRIDHVYKGAIAPGEIIVDQRSLMLYTDAIAAQVGRTHDWAGGSGGCGTIDHEPVGWYAVYGLRRGEQPGWLTTNRLAVFYLRPEPYDVSQLDDLNQRLGLPMTGAGSPDRGVSQLRAALLLGLAGFTSAVGARVMHRNAMRGPRALNP